MLGDGERQYGGDTLRIPEFQALRAELEATSKRTYDTVFFSITASAAIVGYGIEKRQVWVTLIPVLVLFGAYMLIWQSLRSQRRIVAYLRLVHETQERGAIWETLLHESRKKRRQERFRLWVDARFLLLWLFGTASIAATWLSAAPVYSIGALFGTVAATIGWVLVALHMLLVNKKLAGGGPVEQRFYERLKEARRTWLSSNHLPE